MEGSHEQAHSAAAIGSCACSADSVGLRDAARLGRAQGDACANGNSRLMRRRLFGVGITHQALSTGGLKTFCSLRVYPKTASPFAVGCTRITAAPKPLDFQLYRDGSRTQLDTFRWVCIAHKSIPSHLARLSTERAPSSNMGKAPLQSDRIRSRSQTRTVGPKP